jgi:hypothetical protein
MNAWIGKVLKSFIDIFKDSTNTSIQSTVETTSNNNRTCQIMFAVGLEINPAKDNQLIVIPFGNSEGNLVAIGGLNSNIAPDTLGGEARLFSTDETGQTLQAFIKLLNTGILELNGNIDNAVRFSKLKETTDEIQNDITTLKAVFSGWTPVANDGGAALQAAASTWYGTPLVKPIDPAKVTEVLLP